jgi:hypothetical protein
MPTTDTTIITILSALDKNDEKDDRSSRPESQRDEVERSIQIRFLDSVFGSALPWGRLTVGMTVRECENDRIELKSRKTKR